MAHGSFHIGTFLLFVSAVLLIVSSISSPVVNDISLLKVTLTNATQLRHSSVTFGALGHCVLDVKTNDNSDQDDCSPKAIGYDIAGIISATTGQDYSNDALKALTRSLVLHPIAAGLAFIAFLIAALSHCIGFLFASFIAAIAWIITLVIVAIDFSIFGVVKNHVNGSGTGASAEYGVAIWLTLAAFILLFFASITTCFACFTDRRSGRSSRKNNY